MKKGAVAILHAHAQRHLSVQYACMPPLIHAFLQPQVVCGKFWLKPADRRMFPRALPDVVPP